MTDAAQDFITAAQGHFRTLQGIGSGDPWAFVVGAKNWPQHRSPPAVLWRYGRISHAAPEHVGGTSTPIQTELQSFVVQLWYTNEETCRAAKNNLIRAARLAGGGIANVIIGDFDWLTESVPGVTKVGAALQGSLGIKLQVHEKPVATLTVTIKSQRHSETIDS